MPYIKQERRDDVRAHGPMDIGELNYAITSLMLDYIDNNPNSYATYNAAIGALECAKLELYRRAVVPYENHKMEENGDVYEVSG